MFKAKINLLKWKNAQGEDPNTIFYNSKGSDIYALFTKIVSEDKKFVESRG